MADTHSSAAPIILEFPGPASKPYAISPEATAFDVQLLLEARLAQLDGLLAMTYGDGGESFRRLNADLQDRFMWACSCLATETRALYEAVAEMRHREKKGN